MPSSRSSPEVLTWGFYPRELDVTVKALKAWYRATGERDALDLAESMEAQSR